MSWKEPFDQRWPEPVDDLRSRFGRLAPSFSPKEMAILFGLFLVLMAAVVSLLELFV